MPTQRNWAGAGAAGAAGEAGEAGGAGGLPGSRGRASTPRRSRDFAGLGAIVAGFGRSTSRMGTTSPIRLPRPRAAFRVYAVPNRALISAAARAKDTPRFT